MVEMLNASLSGLYQVFTWSTFSLMLLGIAIGFVVGILPGIGGVTTLALMLPFIIWMNAFEAFAFLLGMLAVTSTTGDITSVLFGVPGEGTTVSTIVDGHPMAKKGEAGRALGAVLMSSMVGAAFGAISIAVAIPIVRPIIQTFCSPEFFMLAILGLTFVASLSGGALLKGLIAGGIGLFLATIGLDPITGIKRFTFGQLFLWDGIGLVPISVGFFAIPEIIELMVQGLSIALERAGKLGGVMEGIKDTFRHFWLVLRCSAIGTFTGVIPGMGAGVSQWLAYGHAVQSSPDKERFGKGAVEGVLGPGASNNSVLGGHLITTVAFGVPPSLMSAILFGAFIIQGLVPGPDMLIPEPDGHLGLTFSFVWTIIISNIITVAVCLLFLDQLVKITFVRSSLITPFIILLIYLGAYAEKNVFEDLILMLFFGVLGWIMVKLRWPRPPLIMGLVLGPLTERRFFISISTYGLTWFFRPVVLLILGLTLAGVFYPFIRTRWQRLKKKNDKSSTLLEAVTSDEARGLRFSWATIFDLFILAAFIGALWQSRRFSFRAGLFPWAVGFPVLGLTLVQFIMDLMGKKSGSSIDQYMADSGQELPTHVVRRRTVGSFGLVFGYFLAIWLFGFAHGVALCTFLQLKIGSREGWWLTLILTASAWTFIYGFFDRVLNVPFPTGQVFLWLGLFS